jgi:hypothetical protein
VSVWNPSTLQMMLNTNAYGAFLVFVGALLHGEISRSAIFFYKYPSTYVLKGPRTLGYHQLASAALLTACARRCTARTKLRIVTCGISGGRSLTRPFRDACRFPSTRWYPVLTCTRTPRTFGICPSCKDPFLSRRAKPTRYDSQLLHRCRLLHLLVFATAGAAGQMFIFNTIREFGALVTSTATTMRKFLNVRRPLLPLPLPL